MDEIRMVRDSYDDQAPPSAEEFASARAALFAGSTAPVATAAPDEESPLITLGAPAPAERRTPRRRARWAGAGLGAIAAAAAGVVGVTLLSGSPSSGPDQATTPNLRTPRDLLLAVAERAERLPATEGRYWYTDQIQGQSYIVRPKTGDPYAIIGAHSETFQWWGAKPEDGTAFHGRDLPARPLTPADKAAWSQAGAPTSFRVWSNDHYQVYMSKTTKWDVDDPDPNGGGSFFVQGTGRAMTTAEIRALPTDKDALAKLIFSWRSPAEKLQRAKGRAAAGDGGPLTPDEKLDRVTGLLQDAPVPPKVRGALLRLLADEPGIRVLGESTDPLGRTGLALTADETEAPGGPPDIPIENEPEEEKGAFGSRDETIIDPRTGALLSDQSVLTTPGGRYRSRKPGFVINYWVTREARWTDERPVPPAKKPF